MRVLSLLPHSLTLLALGLTANPVLAQAPKPAPDSLEDELLALLNTPISGASKREQRLMDSPQAIEVLTAEEIRQQGIYRLQDALQLMTSIDVLEADNGFSVVGMRGVMQEGQPRTVQVLVDGVPMYSPLGGPIDISNLPLPIDLVERIEVVRGPSSTLYGANAVVGVISITTKRPDAGFHGGVRGSAGDKRTFRGGASVLSSQGNWSVMAGYTGYSMGASGFKTHYLGRPQALRDYREAPMSLDPAANPFLGSDSGHGYQAMSRVGYKVGGTSLWLEAGQSDKWYGPEGYFSYRKTGRRMALAGWRQAWTEGFSTELRVHRFEQEGHLSQSNYLAVAFEDPGYLGDYKWVDQSTTQVELQANWDFSKTLHFVFGADTRNIKNGSTPFIGLKNGADESASGGFASVDWTAMSGLTLSGGFRVENESLGGSRTSPRVALVWNPSPASALRAGYYTSTRSPQILEARVDLSLFSGQFYPGPSPLPPNIPIYARLLPNPDLKPEKTSNLEVGYRHSVGAVTVDFTLYRMRFTELITTVPLAPYVQVGATTPPFVGITYTARLNVPNQFVNAGNATNLGAELALSWTLRKGMTVGANAAWVDFRRDDALPPTDPQGRDFAYTTKTKGNLWFRYVEGRFTLFTAFQVVGDTLAEALQAKGNPYFENRPAYTQFQANVGWELGAGFHVGAYARNAAREFTLQGATGPERQTPYQAARRELGATVGYRF